MNWLSSQETLNGLSCVVVWVRVVFRKTVVGTVTHPQQSPTTVSLKTTLTRRSHKTNNCYPWVQTIYQTLNYQLVPHCSLHQVHLRIKIKTIFEKRDQNWCALKTLVRSPNVKWFCVCVQNMHLTRAQETCTSQYHIISQSCSEHVGLKLISMLTLFVCSFFFFCCCCCCQHPFHPLNPKKSTVKIQQQRSPFPLSPAHLTTASLCK